MSTVAPIPEAWIEKLFHKMLLEYGKKFTDQWGMVDTSDMIRHWSVELAGFSGDEIRRGVESLSSREWPPTLPDFKKMCRPPVEPVRAYYEAVAGVQARFMGEMGEWSHPAIYWASSTMALELREQSYSAIRARWEAALSMQLEAGAWEPIPAPVLALEAPGKSTTSSEKAKARIAGMINTVLNKPANSDPKGWARRILARSAAGEKMSALQVRFAHEALGAQD